jgi:Flp pilus assembly protein TadG
VSIRQRFRDRDSERGSVSVELVILAPIIGVLLVAVVVVGRVENARADIEGAARSGARDLSIARDPHTAIGRVRESTAAMVRVGEPGCRHFTFNATIDKTNVAVDISCVADLDEGNILPLPGSMTLHASATEVLDVFTERP